MSGVLLAATIGSLAAAVPIVFRVRREYEGAGVLSNFTVGAVWALYTAIVAIVVIAAIDGTWGIGLPPGLRAVPGAALIAAGLALELGGLASMASFRRMSGMQPDRLISGGAYRVSRNPQNVGIGIALAGAAILGDSWLALLAVAGFWSVFCLYVGIEEAHLGRAFGDEYERYRRRTPRLLGPPRRERSSL